MRGLSVAPVLAIAAAAILAGCQPVGDLEAEASNPALDAVPLAANLVGEDCRALPDFEATRRSSNLLRAYDVYCGRWEEPSGRVFEVSAIGGGPSLLGEYTDQSWWRDGLDQTMDCGDGQPTRILRATDALILDCSLRAGGWPYTAIATEIAGSVYLADGIPAALPALENLIGGLSGQTELGETTPAGSRSAAAQRIETLLAGRLFGTGDLQDYRRLLLVAQYYNGIKNFSEAEKRYRDALEIHTRLLAADSPGRGDTLMHLALELSNQERFSEASALFDRADDLLLGATDPTDYPRLISYRALHAANQKLYEDALVLARQATDLRRARAREYGGGGAGDFVTDAGLVQIGVMDPGTGEIRSQRGLSTILETDAAQSLYIEAAMALRLGLIDESKAAIADAASIVDSSRNAPDWWKPQTKVVQAEISLVTEDYAQAERLLRDAIDEQRRLFTESRSEGLALLALGQIFARQDRTEEAFAAYRAAFPIIEAQGGGLRFEDILPFFEAAMAEVERRPELREALYAEMFEVGQLVRGSVTSQTISVAAARLSSSDETIGGLIRELQDAQIARDSLNEEFSRAQADEDAPEQEVDRLEQALATVNADIRSLEQQVQAASPGYNQLIDSPTLAADLIALLRPNEAVVQVLLGEPSSFLFFVTADGVDAHPIAISRTEAAELVELLRIPFDEEFILPEFDVEESHRLFTALFGPVAGQLAGVDHLVTIPTGPLLSLPLQVLVTEPPPRVVNYNYTGVRWLGAQHALTLAPSVRAFVDLRGTARPSSAPNTFVGFGDFVPLRDPGELLARRDLPEICRTDIQRLESLGRLPETRDELRSIAGSLGVGTGNLFLGTAFSEDKLRDAPLNDYRVLYFATHGLLPGELDCWSEPSLLVSPTEDGGPGDDGLLEASEIINLNLDAELVVLSACNTGGEGGEGGGESLTGLARAFFYAGARSLLVSHWAVDSFATVDLMSEAFEGLGGAGLTTAEALRQSQLAMMRDGTYSHPYYWGAFTVVGDGGRQLVL